MKILQNIQLQCICLDTCILLLPRPYHALGGCARQVMHHRANVHRACGSMLVVPLKLMQQLLFLLANFLTDLMPPFVSICKRVTLKKAAMDTPQIKPDQMLPGERVNGAFLQHLYPWGFTQHDFEKKEKKMINDKIKRKWNKTTQTTKHTTASINGAATFKK